MLTTLKCPNCQTEIPIDQALAAEISKGQEKALEEVRKQTAAEAQKGFEARLTATLHAKDEELRTILKRNQELQEEMTAYIKKAAALEQKGREQELELAKKLAEGQEKIRAEAQKQITAETQLKVAEKDKKIADMEKMVEELKRTAQQGSQQTQGEVLELELEERLKKEFPNDVIREVPKGIRGADVIQEVHDKYGKACGLILWESKNAKWSNTWVQKLKDDQRAVKADMAILMSVDLPKELTPFKPHQGILITNRESAIPLAAELRIRLYELSVLKQANTGKGEKMEDLYAYVTSNDFRQRVEAIIEAFSAMNEDIEREKRWFTLKWARQEKYIRKVLDQTHALYGDLEGITGESLPELKTLQLPEGGKDSL